MELEFDMDDAVPSASTVVRTTQKISPSLLPVSPPESNAGDIEEPSWIGSVRKQLNSAAPKPYPGRQWTIFRVPDHIRRGEGEAYDPLVVSIGPYYWRNTSISKDHKWQCVRYLLSRHRSRERASELLDRCLSKLRALDTKVRSCYSEDVRQDEQDLALTMLRDGCFIIHLLLKQAKTDSVEAKEEEVVLDVEEEKIEVEKGSKERLDHGKEEENIVELEIGEEEEVIKNPLLGILWIWNLVAYDLLKLENQIPFFVVQTLFDILATPADKGLDLPKLALQLFRDIHPNMSRGFASLPASQVHHLLHLFHSSLVPSQPQPSSPPEHVCAKSPPEWIPSATELTRGGIKFKTNEAAGSFLDVSFKDGIVAIPPLRVYDYTNPLFRNLIAFEQCYPNTRTYVTIYAAFMDCIIDDAEDVKLLDAKGILVNRLSTDEAVADLFNKLCVQIHYASDRNYLADVFVRVTEYHESKLPQWRAELIRNYFSSPWVGIAVAAAVLLFLLTIEQSVFAALSYFRPP
ncbi:UPF0481 protein-like [Iris pallida]|uniref:UPF0481 protein-like n=1 Tax=Iris pallida TaxID=29817 RepID=A0AAX6HZM6_IRIPA|nr:UPF0481 protein-like [Iris pallida]KAJ6846183.1 UPF0481 protein-like [Iris pallida]